MDHAAAEMLVRLLSLRPETATACPACLFGVSSALRIGNERDLQRAVRTFGPPLWAEGLGRPVREALERAREAGAAGAADALDDFGSRGPRSAIYQAVVVDLARQQAEEAERAYRAAFN